jgi:hypothetical protein
MTRTTSTRSTKESAPAEKKSRRTTSSDSSSTPTKFSGWSSVETLQSGDFAQEFKVSEKPQLFRFIETAPVAGYRQHWITRKGKQSFTCVEDDCPLCDDLGNKPQAKFVFNVGVYVDESWVNKILVTGSRLAKQIKGFNEQKGTSPINDSKIYWTISKSGKGTDTTYSLLPQKARDLEDDLDATPADEDELTGLEDDAYTYDDVVQFQARSELQEIADEVADGD